MGGMGADLKRMGGMDGNFARTFSLSFLVFRGGGGKTSRHDLVDFLSVLPMVVAKFAGLPPPIQPYQMQCF